jgi:two-component SAPR family response regulator
MTQRKSFTSLVTAGNPKWRGKYAAILIMEGLDVHTASERTLATDLLRKHQYDLVIADESIGEPELLEFALTLRDIKSPMPVTLIAEDDNERHQKLWERINVFFVGERSAVASKIGDAVSIARGNGGSDS